VRSKKAGKKRPRPEVREEILFENFSKSSPEDFSAEKMWVEEWNDFVRQNMEGLRNPQNDIQAKLREILEDKLRVRWMKKLENMTFMGSAETEDPPVRILTYRLTSWRDLFFPRLMLELKFGVVFLFLYLVPTFLLLSLVSLIAEVRYTPLIYFLFIPAVGAMYGGSSCGYTLLRYAVPLIGTICWLVSSNGPAFKTILLLWVLTILYSSCIHLLTFIVMDILRQINIFNAFERDYLLILRCLK
jgi:hypothetical protein